MLSSHESLMAAEKLQSTQNLDTRDLSIPKQRLKSSRLPKVMISTSESLFSLSLMYFFPLDVKRKVKIYILNYQEKDEKILEFVKGILTPTPHFQMLLFPLYYVMIMISSFPSILSQLWMVSSSEVDKGCLLRHLAPTIIKTFSYLPCSLQQLSFNIIYYLASLRSWKTVLFFFNCGKNSPPQFQFNEILEKILEVLQHQIEEETNM